MTDHFCTYFDHRYAPKGLAMWESLKFHRPSAILHVLCLNDACHEILQGLQLTDVYLHPLRALEEFDPALAAVRGTRSLIEYYFTLTPSLQLYLFHRHSEIDRLSYVDADLFFLADPEPVFEELFDSSIGIIEHRFPADLAYLEKYGRFNVGWLTFRNDAQAHACLESWRTQCLEWCYDRLEGERFADQKYLNEWPERFPRVTVIEHRGANVAPWNLNRFELEETSKGLWVGGDPLLFFHAHGFQPTSPGRTRQLNLAQYHVDPTPLLIRNIFQPYESALLAATEQVAAPLALALLSDRLRETAILLEDANHRASMFELELRVSEADRSARLQSIEQLQSQLAASEADRAARLDSIHSLQVQLAATEADSAARLGLIHSLQAQLQASESDRAARLEAIHALQKHIAEIETEKQVREELTRSLEAEPARGYADRADYVGEIQKLTSAIETLVQISRQSREGSALRRFLRMLLGN